MAENISFSYYLKWACTFDVGMLERIFWENFIKNMYSAKKTLITFILHNRGAGREDTSKKEEQQLYLSNQGSKPLQKDDI